MKWNLAKMISCRKKKTNKLKRTGFFIGALVFDCGHRLGIQKLGNFLLSSPLMLDTDELLDADDLDDTTLVSVLGVVVDDDENDVDGGVWAAANIEAETVLPSDLRNFSSLSLCSISASSFRSLSLSFLCFSNIFISRAFSLFLCNMYSRMASFSKIQPSGLLNYKNKVFKALTTKKKN